MRTIKQYIFFILFLTLLNSSFAQKKTYHIGILLDNHTEKLSPLLKQLQNQVSAVVGEDAIVVFPKESILVNQFNLQNAQQNYQKLINNNTDIILAFGVINSKVVASQTQYPKPTILLGTVNQDISAINLEKKTSGVKNFTYLIESESYIDDFKTFKELTNFKNVGIAIEKPIANALPLTSVFNELFKNIDANYTLIPFDAITDITENLNNIDAVYLAGGFFLTEENIQQLAQALIDKKLPSFTALGIEEVQLGLMATQQAEDNLDQFIRRIALTVESYINGTPLAKMPIYIEYSPSLTINYNTAQQIGVPIKYSLIANTNFVGNLKDASAEKTYNLLEVINDVLEQNLSLKSQNKDIDLASQEIKTAKSNYLPNLTVSATGTYIDPDLAEISNGQNPEFSTSGNVTLQQTIFSEAANANITIQKKLQKAQQENYNAQALDAVFDASNAYFNVLILKANVDIQLRNLELTKQNLKIAEQNFKAGEKGKSDMLRFQSQKAQDTQNLVEAINQLEQGFIALNQLLNNPLERQIEIEDTDLSSNIFKNYKYEQLVSLLDNPTTRDVFIEFLTEEAKNNAPELKSLQYNLEAVQRSLKLNSSGRFLPTVALQGQYNRVFNRSGVGSEPGLFFPQLDDNYNVGLNVSIPIFNRNLNNINKQTNIIQQDQLNINKENIELSINANMRASVLNLVNQISNIELSGVSEQAAKESLELTQTAYASGAVTIIQLIDAQNNYLNAQLASTNAGYNFLISGLQLERVLGYYFLINSEDDNTKFTQRFMDFLNSKN